MMKNTSKKIVFFFDLNWKNVLKAFMLSILSVSGFYAAGADGNKEEQAAAGSGMTGTVKIIDATTVPGGTTGTRANAVQSGSQQSGPGREAQVREEDLLQKQLFEMLERFQKEFEVPYRRLRLSVAATLASREKHVVSEREDQLLEVLARDTENSRRLARKTVEFCDYVEALMRHFPMGKVQSAELALKLDDARSEARKVWDQANPTLEAPKVARCRLLAVQEDLQIVVLPVGSNHGVFCGLNYYVGKDTALRVISVRPYISAAVITDGSIRDLAPGMEARTEKEL